jgi:hypothetical protein
LSDQPPFPRHPVRLPAISTASTGKAISDNLANPYLGLKTLSARLPYLANSTTGLLEFAFNRPEGLPDVSDSLQGSTDLIVEKNCGEALTG